MKGPSVAWAGSGGVEVLQIEELRGDGSTKHSSCQHATPGMQTEHYDVSGMRAYGRSRVANTWFTKELAPGGRS